MEQQKINRVTQAEYDYLVRQYQQALEYQNESWLPRHTEVNRPSASELLFILQHTVIMQESEEDSELMRIPEGKTDIIPYIIL